MGFKVFTNDNGKYLINKLKSLLNRKQDKLTEGNGITISNVENKLIISSNIIDDTKDSSTIKTYSISKIKSMIGSPLRYIGNKSTLQEVLDVKNKVTGDVYSVTENQTTYAFDSELNAVAIGTTDVEISGFYTKNETDEMLVKKQDVLRLGNGLTYESPKSDDADKRDKLTVNVIDDNASTDSKDKTYSANKIFINYLSKSDNASVVYINDSSTTPTTVRYSIETTADTIVKRDVNGGINVYDTPSANTYAINLNTLNKNRNFDTANDGNNRNVSLRFSGKPKYKGNVPDSVFGTNSLSLSQGYDESSGISFDGDKIVMWSPCDTGCINYYDEDNASTTPVFRIDNNGRYITPKNSRLGDVFQAASGWTIEKQYVERYGSFIMLSMRVRKTDSSINVGSTGFTEICNLNSTKKYYSESDQWCALQFTSLQSNAWDGGNPFTGGIWNGHIYVGNTANITRTIGVATYYISGVYPLQNDYM